jgi:hypothetical protein
MKLIYSCPVKFVFARSFIFFRHHNLSFEITPFCTGKLTP